jgi:hypothetical protein
MRQDVGRCGGTVARSVKRFHQPEIASFNLIQIYNAGGINRDISARRLKAAISLSPSPIDIFLCTQESRREMPRDGFS